MATIFIEGFDKYGTTTSGSTLSALLTQGEWTVASISNSTIAAPLSATGQSLYLNTGNDGNYLVKTLPASYPRLIGGYRFASNLGGAKGMGVSFGATNTYQSSIIVNPVIGTISIMTGTTEGTTLATSSANITAGVAHYLEWDITFGASSPYSIWLDGALIITGTGNTGSSSVNQLLLGSSVFNGNSVAFTYFDDLYLFDTTTSFNNAVLLTNPRIETQLPNANSAVAWSPLGADTNWLAVAMNPAPGTDTEAIQAATAPLEDLYDFPALTNNPGKIYTVAVKTNSKITVTGTANLTLQTKSATVDSAGSASVGYAPSLSYSWYDSYFDTDPNTSAQWSPTAVNAATSGPKRTV